MKITKLIKIICIYKVIYSKKQTFIEKIKWEVTNFKISIINKDCTYFNQLWVRNLKQKIRDFHGRIWY